MVLSNPKTNRVGHAQEQSIIKWKWYISERAKKGESGIAVLHEKIADVGENESSPIKPTILEESPVKWGKSYEDLTAKEQQHAWFTDGSARYVNGKRQWKSVAYNPKLEKHIKMEGHVETIIYWKIHEEARIPERATPLSAGLDLSALDVTVITSGKVVPISTGLGCQIPKGHYGQIATRSSFALKGAIVVGGIIDADYQGEIKVLMLNLEIEPLIIEKKQNMAQMLLIPVNLSLGEEGHAPTELTVRGDKGFGSSDVTNVGAKIWVQNAQGPPSEAEISFLIVCGTLGGVFLDIVKAWTPGVQLTSERVPPLRSPAAGRRSIFPDQSERGDAGTGRWELQSRQRYYPNWRDYLRIIQVNASKIDPGHIKRLPSSCVKVGCQAQKTIIIANIRFPPTPVCPSRKRRAWSDALLGGYGAVTGTLNGFDIETLANRMHNAGKNIQDALTIQGQWMPTIWHPWKQQLKADKFLLNMQNKSNNFAWEANL
ncbi:unnamed protein product [Ranitomeya imitator]|uniref:dUTP diphosphatase n=1 Tax=Ranitomeya imitator TaxID=111125 RepID=A0ABN9L4T3_9NEOB|nr:unnamed protein product [Ranitomeya imitator]